MSIDSIDECLPLEFPVCPYHVWIYQFSKHVWKEVGLSNVPVWLEELIRSAMVWNVRQMEVYGPGGHNADTGRERVFRYFVQHADYRRRD